MQTYDLLVIGSGPAGQRAAIQGAKLGKRVALVEKREVVGGACINLLDQYLHEMVKMSPLQGSAFEVIPTSDVTALVGAAVSARRAAEAPPAGN